MNEQFHELPFEIAKQERKVSEARTQLDNHILKLKIDEAKLRIYLSANKNLTQAEKEAKITLKLEEELADKIKLEAKLREEEIEFNRLTNTYLGVRKEASYRIAEMQNL